MSSSVCRACVNKYISDLLGIILLYLVRYGPDFIHFCLTLQLSQQPSSSHRFETGARVGVGRFFDQGGSIELSDLKEQPVKSKS